MNSMPIAQQIKPHARILISQAVARIKSMSHFRQLGPASRTSPTEAESEVPEFVTLSRQSTASSSGSDQHIQVPPGHGRKRSPDEQGSWNQRTPSPKRAESFFGQQPQLNPFQDSRHKRLPTEGIACDLAAKKNPECQSSAAFVRLDAQRYGARPATLPPMVPQEQLKNIVVPSGQAARAKPPLRRSSLLQNNFTLEQRALAQLAASVDEAASCVQTLETIFAEKKCEEPLDQICEEMKSLVAGCTDGYFLPEIVRCWLEMAPPIRHAIKQTLAAQPATGRSLLLVKSDMDLLLKAAANGLGHASPTKHSSNALVALFSRKLATALADANEMYATIPDNGIKESTTCLGLSTDAVTALDVICQAIPELESLAKKRAFEILLAAGQPNLVATLCFGLLPIVAQAKDPKFFPAVLQAWLKLSPTGRSMAKELLRWDRSSPRSLKLLLPQLFYLSAKFSKQCPTAMSAQQKSLLTLVLKVSPYGASAKTFANLEHLFTTCSSGKSMADAVGVAQAGKEIMAEIYASVGTPIDETYSGLWIPVLADLCALTTQAVEGKKSEIADLLRAVGYRNNMRACLLLVREAVCEEVAYSSSCSESLDFLSDNNPACT